MAQATPTSPYGESTTLSNTKPATSWPLRAALVATTSYVASSHMPCQSHSSVGIVVTYASVDYTSLQLWIEGSRDGTNFFQIAQRGVTVPAVYTITLANLSSATDDAFLIDVPTHAGVLFLRAQVKRTGGSAVGTIAIDGFAGTVT